MLRIAACLLLLVVGLSTHAAAPRPDIVFIIADDLGSHDVGFMGSTELKTPNLDALAKRGTILNQFYVQPVCTPTRAALITGRYPMRYGLQVGVIRPWAEYGLPLEERMLPQALKEAGYATRMVGKWHLGSHDKAYFPSNRGFEEFYGHLFGALDYFTHIRDGKPDWYRNDQLITEEGYSTHLLTREAVRMINERPKDKPMFLYVAYNAVHAPLQVPDKYKEPYENLDGTPNRKIYAGMLAAMDEGIGRIVDAVEKSGRRNNTLFVFTSDNGGPNPGKLSRNGPYRAGKHTLYEGGVRVCAFATWDGKIPAGAKHDQLLHIADWYPTLINLAGASLEQKLPLDGLDLWATLTEGKPSPRNEVLVNSEPNRGALRVGDWKLVLGGNPDPANPRQGRRGADRQSVELFNLKDDPGEKTNLDEKHPEQVRTLRERYEAYAKAAAKPKNTEGVGE